MQLITKNIDRDIYGAPLRYMMDTTAHDLWAGTGDPKTDPPYFTVKAATVWWLAHAREVIRDLSDIRVADDYSAWLPDGTKPAMDYDDLCEYMRKTMPVDLALWDTYDRHVGIPDVHVVIGTPEWIQVVDQMDTDIYQYITDKLYPCSRQEFADAYVDIYYRIKGDHPHFEIH
ncbi:MAG: hypothetical protein [Caudoviricetes sp.]|nr:MAG: hypothetical protein [Caudoviricetes sp.]